MVEAGVGLYRFALWSRDGPHVTATNSGSVSSSPTGGPTFTPSITPSAGPAIAPPPARPHYLGDCPRG